VTIEERHEFNQITARVRDLEGQLESAQAHLDALRFAGRAVVERMGGGEEPNRLLALVHDLDVAVKRATVTPPLS